MKTVLPELSKYRFQLVRDLKPRAEVARMGLIRENCVVFVMLNPSTADATTDDPTIRRCKRFAEERGYSRLEVLNLFPYRATKPERLRDWMCEDRNEFYEMMQQNDTLIDTECEGRDVVIAWGAHAKPYGSYWVTLYDRIKHKAKNVYCLGKTQAGYPRHPLYVPASAEWLEYKT